MSIESPPPITPLFATPFGVVPLADAATLNPLLAALFATRATAEHRDPQSHASPLAFRSRDDLYDWPDDPVRRLCGGILAGASSIITAINEFTDGQFASLSVQARAWFTIVRTDGCVPPASYPNASWCAVYCVAASEPSPARFDSGVLRLHEARLGSMFADASNSLLRLPYRPGHCTWRPVAGELAVFPAAVSHEIALVRGTGALVIVTACLRFVGPGQTGMPTW